MSSYMGLAVALYPSASQTIESKAAAASGLIIKGYSGATADIFVVTDWDGNENLAVEDGGRVAVSATSTTDIPLVTIRYTGSTQDLFAAYDQDGSTKRFSVQDGGNVLITQNAAADVGIKLVQASTPTADAFAVYANDGSTQRFGITKNHGLLLRVRTTKPATGLTKGELLLLFHNSTPRLAVCTSTAADRLKMVRLRSQTLGRLTA